MKTIKRYLNRKLYDVNKSCYVTIPQITQRLIQGEEIEFISNVDKSDISNFILGQCLVGNISKYSKEELIEILKRKG